MASEAKSPKASAQTDAKTPAADAAAPSSVPSDAPSTNLPFEIDDNDQPLDIISINADNSTFQLREDNLKRIFDQVEKINPKRVIVVSVVGAFRTGKSFLLSFFLRYLRYCQFHKVSKCNGAEWLKWAGNSLSEGNYSSQNEKTRKAGFIWKAGKERMTTGISMYGKPFEHILENGEKVAVLIMDTQGMFDFETSRELTAAIFGLSTLISSYEIYNISKQIQEDKLQQLHYFTEFSKVALKEFEQARARARAASKKPAASKEDDDEPPNMLSGKSDLKEAAAADVHEDDSKSESMHAFQTLEFLVRDWQNFTDEENVEQSLSEMPQVLEDAFKQNVDDQGTRKEIQAAFERISCFLLPFPGKKMTAMNYDGDLAAIDASFLALLDKFVHHVFDEGLVTKRIQGREVSASQLYRYIKAYAEVFKEGRLPKTLTLVEAISMTTNMCAKEDAFNLYKEKMDAETKTKSYLSEPELKLLHANCALEALQLFDTQATFGSDENIQSMRSQLEKSIDQEEERYIEMNKHKLNANLEKYIFFVLFAVVAWVVDLITDYTCDHWLQVCRDTSKFMHLFYWCVIAALIFEFAKIYKQQGPVAVGVAGMTLGQHTLEKVQEIQNKVMEKLGSKRNLHEGVGSGSKPSLASSKSKANLTSSSSKSSLTSSGSTSKIHRD